MRKTAAKKQGVGEMLKLGSLALGGLRVPRVAIGYSDAITEADILEARAGGVDVAEIRVDLFRSVEPSLRREKALPHSSRCPPLPPSAPSMKAVAGRGRRRTAWPLFEKILPHVDAVDVELSSLKDTARIVAAARKMGKLAVISHHDQETTPKAKALEGIIRQAQNAGADIIKVATHVQTQS